MMCRNWNRSSRRRNLCFPNTRANGRLGQWPSACPPAIPSGRSHREICCPSLRWQSLLYGPDKAEVRWAASYDVEALYIIVADAASSNQFSSTSVSSVTVKVEPRRLWPAKHFLFDTGADRPGMEKRVLKGTGTWVLRIPLELIGIPWKASLPFGRLPRAVLLEKSRGDMAAECSQREREWSAAKNRCQSRRHAHRLPHQQTERRCPASALFLFRGFGDGGFVLWPRLQFFPVGRVFGCGHPLPRRWFFGIHTAFGIVLARDARLHRLIPT